MKATRDDILNVSVRLFAERGFEGVSTSMIAGELGMTKGALYRHFESKQGIFDAIIEKMFALDAARASEERVPEKRMSEDPESYRQTEFSDFCEYVPGQFDFWTENEFAANFRRMVALEQYKSAEMCRLYQDVMVRGPVEYSVDLFNEMIQAGRLCDEARSFGARNLAMQLYAPLLLSIQLADGGADRTMLRQHLVQVVQEFKNRWGR